MIPVEIRVTDLLANEVKRDEGRYCGRQDPYDSGPRPGGSEMTEKHQYPLHECMDHREASGRLSLLRSPVGEQFAPLFQADPPSTFKTILDCRIGQFLSFLLK